MQMVEPWLKGPVLAQEKIVEALEAVIVPGDRIVMEGDNQKQADFLSRSLVKVRCEENSRPASDHLQHQPAGASHTLRARYRKESRLRVCRTPESSSGAAS